MNPLAKVPGIVSKSLDPMMKAAVLTKTAARAPDGRGGFTKATTDHDCRAMITRYSDKLIAASEGVIGVKDRKAIVIAQSLIVTPERGDGFTLDGSWTVENVDKDPAGATFVLQLKPA